MVAQLLTYAQVISPRYEEDLTLDFLNHNDQTSAIDKIEEDTKQELAEFEAEYQRRRTIIENKGQARVARINLLYENTILVENNSHKNSYPAPKDFMALVEGQVGVINFIKDPAISGPAVKTVFTVIKVASYAYIVPAMKAKGIQLIKNYLSQVPVVGLTLSASLNMGLSIINLPNAFAKWAWDPTKYWVQSREVDCDGSLGDYIFNEDGTPEMYETSNRKHTKFFGIVISVAASPFIAQGIIDRINELRLLHLSNQDWARTFFCSYFKWKVKKLRDIEAQYSIPDIFQNDPILNQPKYKCAKSGQFLIIPFKTPSNRVFQYSVIEDWLLSHHTCPVTEENLQANQLSFDATTYDEIRYRLRSITR
jgi:hypothetical protein